MNTLFKHSIIIVAAVILAASQCVMAQDNDYNNGLFANKKYNKWNSSVNFKKGLQAANDDTESAYVLAQQYFEKEAKQHPSNGYALCNEAVMIMRNATIALNKGIANIWDMTGITEEEAQEIYQKLRDERYQAYKVAIDKMEKGLKLLPAADKANLCLAHLTLANMYDEIDEDYNLVGQHIKQAVDIHPCRDAYQEYFDYCINAEKNDEAEAVADKLAQYIDGDVYWMPKVAKVYYDNEHYDKALPWLNKTLDIDHNDTDCLELRSKIRLQNEDYAGAIADVLAQADEKTNDLLINDFTDIYNVEAAKPLVLSELKRLQNETKVESEEELPTNWYYIEGVLRLNEDMDYAAAMSCLQRSLKVDYQAHTLSELAQCAFLTGDAPRAFSYLKCATINGENEDSEALSMRQNLLGQKIIYELFTGKVDDMMRDLEIYNIAFEGIDRDIDEQFANYLSWGYETKKDYDKALKAIEDYNDPTNIEHQIFKGRMMQKLGRDSQARELLENALQNAETEDQKMGALFYLGKTQESRAILDKIADNTDNIVNLEPIEDEEGNITYPTTLSFYRLAQAYALHGDSAKALHYLDEWFSGSDFALNFEMTRLDSHFDSIKHMPEFNQLIDRYKTQWLNGKYVDN